MRPSDLSLPFANNFDCPIVYHELFMKIKQSDSDQIKCEYVVFNPKTKPPIFAGGQCRNNFSKALAKMIKHK